MTVSSSGLPSDAGRAEHLALFLTLLGALAIRLAVWPRVFLEGHVVFSGPDAYYHLRRAFATVLDWPHAPQIDHAINAPVGGLISWPPLFDGLLATLALPWRSDPVPALELIGAFLPVVLGLLCIVVLYRLVRRLAGPRAALVAAIVAAVLPGMVAYTRLGALDHDPFFELAVLLALDALVASAGTDRPTGPSLQLATALGMAVLGWAGSPLGVALVAFVGTGWALATARREIWRRLGITISCGSTLAVVVTAPFVATSVWTRTRGATFEGLSILHLATLLGLAALGTMAVLLSRDGPRLPWLALGLAQAGLLAWSLPASLGPLLAGAQYATGDAPLLHGVAEGQGLLFLFGELDLRPLEVRLGLLPLGAAVLVPWRVFRGPDRARWTFLLCWLLVTLGVALQHSRFTFSASFALAAFAGVSWDTLREQASRRILAVLGLLFLAPAAAAYVPIPGWEPHYLLGRQPLIASTGMLSVCEFLGAEAPPTVAWRDPSAPPERTVLAPWSHGHWIVWSARQAVVASPMLSVGQSEFEAAVSFFLETDREAARSFLHTHRVRHLVVEPSLDQIVSAAAAGGRAGSRFGVVDPQTGRRSILLPAAMEVVTAHLAYWGPGAVEAFDRIYPAIPWAREVYRTPSTVPSPFGGTIPKMRVYEVNTEPPSPPGPGS